jgi:hypothetical protein
MRKYNGSNRACLTVRMQGNRFGTDSRAVNLPAFLDSHITTLRNTAAYKLHNTDRSLQGK